MPSDNSSSGRWQWKQSHFPSAVHRVFLSLKHVQRYTDTWLNIVFFGFNSSSFLWNTVKDTGFTALRETINSSDKVFSKEYLRSSCLCTLGMCTIVHFRIRRIIRKLGQSENTYNMHKGNNNNNNNWAKLLQKIAIYLFPTKY